MLRLTTLPRWILSFLSTPSDQWKTELLQRSFNVPSVLLFYFPICCMRTIQRSVFSVATWETGSELVPGQVNKGWLCGSHWRGKRRGRERNREKGLSCLSCRPLESPEWNQSQFPRSIGGERWNPRLFASWRKVSQLKVSVEAFLWLLVQKQWETKTEESLSV